MDIINTYSTKSPKSVSILGANQFMDNWLDGLHVDSYGTITLNSALATSNGGGFYDGYGYGASLDNCQYDNGCTAVTPMAVNLTGNNVFSGNYDLGLFVQSKGAITVNNVNAVANGLANGRDGAYLDNDFTGAVGGVSVTNTAAYSPSFNGNGYDGLEVYSLGTITVMDLDAQDNGNDGVYLENDYAGAVNVSLGTARAGWVNSLSGNGLDGLDVYSKGLVTLANIDAENNGYYDSSIYQPVGDGVYVNNTSSPTFLGVTLTGKNYFDNNYLNGLEIYSNGAITLNSVEADNNGYYVGVDTGNPDTSYLSYGYGAWLDNRNSPALLGVTITGTNAFDGNHLSGLQVSTKGAITLNSIQANNNGYNDPSSNDDAHVKGVGAFLDNCGLMYRRLVLAAITPKTITLTGVNELDYNSLGGLVVWSRGAITLTDVDAIGNNSDGAYLDNTRGTITAGVTLININVFAENSSNGFEVHTNGAITTSNLVANSNGGRGALLDNCGYIGALAPPPLLLRSR